MSQDAINPTRRVLFASLVGTTVEFYDFYVFATAASLVFGPLFFPASSPTAQLLSAYATFSLAFIARPLGAFVFGHYGDRVGRKSTLVASLMLMGASTFAIAFLPTYATAGWIAPLLLCVLRFGQGLGLGGEWGGAALLAVENAPPGWKARFGMVPQLGAPLGFIAANGLFLILGLLLTAEDFVAWGWRLPFLVSALLVILGLWVRLRLVETPAFAAALKAEAPPRIPLAAVFRHHLRATFAGTFAVVACFALFYLTTAFALGYGTTTRAIPRETFLSLQLGAILFMAVGIVLAGWWADHSSPRRVLVVGCIGTLVSGLTLAPLLGGGLPAVFLFLAFGLFVMGFVYGPLGAFLPGLYPPLVRYTGASVAFNVGGILGGSLAPFLATTLADHGGLGLVGAYLAAAGLLSLAGLAAIGPGQAEERPTALI